MVGGRREVVNEVGKRQMLCSTSGGGKPIIPNTETCPGLALPGELIERILSFLPLTCIFKFRSVCKEWNRLMSSQVFLKTCCSEPFGRPLFFFFADNWNRSVVAYKFESRRWFKVPFGCVPNLTNVKASSGNLILCKNLVGRADGFVDDGYVVCNPTTRAWIQLPQPPLLYRKISPRVLTMKQLGEGSSSSFQVIQSITVDGHETGGNGCFTLLQGYSSETNQWTIVGRIQHSIASIVWSNDTIHCLSTSSRIVCSSKVGSHQWQSVYLPPDHRFWKLLKWEGVVILPGICCSTNDLVVWMLNENDTQTGWTNVGQVDAHARGRFDPVVCGDIIVFVGHTNLLTFNLRKKLWRILPSCPYMERSCREPLPSSWSCQRSLFSPF
ncbi:hypothetical protein M758_3G039300 [Ceratodon purpureus]|nr:hypothetical protein M758_3G039300 [Ceratodon purpureus]